MRQINTAGLELIKSFEGLRLEAYQDQVGVWTIGYGSTFGVTSGMSITEDEATERLLKDLATAEGAVERLVTRDVNDNEFAALVSFTFNLGQGALQKSTLLNCLNLGQRQNAAVEFLKWCKAGGVENAGLLRRREAEKALFLTPPPLPTFS